MFDRCKKIALQCRAEYWVYGISVTSQLRSNITAGQLVGLLQREEQRCHHHQDIETSEMLDFARKGKKISGTSKMEWKALKSDDSDR